uniref:Ribosome-recycling factor, mitochondrial n=1 Tax=Strongyloides venezuelensis TaxID=75913 RepID=A0A0K0G0Z5_STRVS
MMRRCILSSRTIFSCFNTIKLRNSIPPATSLQYRELNLSLPLQKIKKGQKGKNYVEFVNIDEDNSLLTKAKNEMEDLEKVLVDELVKHFSLQVDIRVYENILVQLDDKTSKKMNHLGRVSCKNPHMVMIDFSENPVAIKNAKLAIQKSALNVNPQQEGVVLYIPIPRMTRERREQLSQLAKTKLFNDYKNALNQVYVKADEKSAKTSTTTDIAKSNRTYLLNLKKAMEKRGLAIVEEKQKTLLREIA